MGEETPDPATATHRRAAPLPRLSLVQRLLLPAALLLPLAILGLGAWIAWRAAWDEARAELARTADAAAEHARSLLELHRLRGRFVEEMLDGLGAEQIRARQPQLHARLHQVLAPGTEPASYSVFVFDAAGSMVLSSERQPAPGGDFSDREYFRALSAPGAPRLQVGEVALGRTGNRLFFPVSMRREGAGGAFAGLINISVWPEGIAEGLARLRGQPGDILSLVRQDGAVLARTRPLDRPPPWRQPAGSSVLALISTGAERLEAEGPSPLDGTRRLFAYRRLEGWPLYASVARDRAAIVARWRERALLLLALGLPATFALAMLSLLARRAQEAAEAGQAGLEVRVAQRTAELARSTAELAESEGRLRVALEAADLGTWEMDCATGATERTPRTLAIFGMGPEHAHGTHAAWHDFIHPQDRPRVREGLDALRRGESERYAMEYRFERPDGRMIWVESCARTVQRAPDGTPRRIAGTVQDVTARREAEERRALLAREVDHRAKNVLAVVQAALRLTPRTDAATYARAVEGRVAALARAHTLLAAQRWAGAGLREVLEGELSAFLLEGGGSGGPQAELHGPPLRVSPSAAQSLSLVVHELATNAVKHGALSVPAGRLGVSWSVEAQPAELLLRWRESGGPAPRADAPRGFGSRLIGAVVRDQLGGALALDWAEDGLRVEMRFPLSRIGLDAAEPQELSPAI